MMRFAILFIELAIIWLVYFWFGFVTAYDMPLWMTTFLVIMVDRTTTAITNIAMRKRTHISQ